MQPCSMPFGRIGCVALMLFFSACSSVPHVQTDQAAVPAPPRYSIVFMIHGDGNYRYHDSEGKAYQADEEALQGALRVAANNPNAEVFIFHETKKRRALLFIPRSDGSFYYYRNGALLGRESYRRETGRTRFNPAVALYDRFRAEDVLQPIQLFLYFGHEIPEFHGTGYDASYARDAYTVTDLATGLQQFTRGESKFDLVVLSTCYNGTPHTISTLAPYAKTIVASPDNLHLSYFDIEALERLDLGLLNGDVTVFATNFAQRAFDKLTRELQTPVTVVAYDVDRVQGYLDTVDGAYATTLTSLKKQPPGFFEHYDCADDTAFAVPGMSDGVHVFYRPARFGRSADKKDHSGWECWMIPKNPL